MPKQTLCIRLDEEDFAILNLLKTIIDENLSDEVKKKLGLVRGRKKREITYSALIRLAIRYFWSTFMQELSKEMFGKIEPEFIKFALDIAKKLLTCREVSVGELNGGGGKKSKIHHS